MKTKAMCSGCHNDVYNHGCGGAKGCWSFKEAKVVTRWEIGTHTLPATPGAFTERKTLDCYQRPGVAYILAAAGLREGAGAPTDGEVSDYCQHRYGGDLGDGSVCGARRPCKTHELAVPLSPDLVPSSEGSGTVRIEILAGFVRLVVEDNRGAIHGDLTPDIARKLASALYDAARQAEQGEV